MKKTIMSLLMVVCAVVSATAQIGYQVTVFDEAKKAPKANQAVSATVTITDNSGKVICTDNVSGTTDEFGILSMSVGNATTFSNVDWSKLPLWISATVDGVTISKTQILSVPVAEHAKHYGSLTPEILCSKTWNCSYTHPYGTIHNTLTLSSSGSCTLRSNQTWEDDILNYAASYNWFIVGDQVVLIRTSGDFDNDIVVNFIPQKNYLIVENHVYK